MDKVSQIVDDAIDRYDLKKVWSDTVYQYPEDQLNKMIEVKRKDAIDKLSELMRSRKCCGSARYSARAVKAVLGLRPTKARYRGSTTPTYGMQHRS